MTPDPPSDTEITSPEAFEEALEDLLLATLDNDVNPEGAWEYRLDGDGADWEVMILKLQNKDSPE